MLPGSRNCDLVRTYLTSNGFDFNEIDISKNLLAAKDMYEISNQHLVPVTVVDERVVIGYRPEVFDLIFFDKVDDA